MATWADLASAVADLRRFVNDGPTDRPIKTKQVIGLVNGVNQEFLTFEDRIVVGTLRVTVDFVPLAPAAVSLVDPVLGMFTLATAPVGGSVVRASYYFQYFLDSELQEAIQLATEQLTDGGDDPTQLTPGLKTAALLYGAHFGFTKQSIRWVQRASSRFLLEEEPIQQEALQRSNLFDTLAKRFFDEARIVRDDYYKRQGRSLGPAFSVFKPRIPRVGPRR